MTTTGSTLREAETVAGRKMTANNEGGGSLESKTARTMTGEIEGDGDDDDDDEGGINASLGVGDGVVRAAAGAGVDADPWEGGGKRIEGGGMAMAPRGGESPPDDDVIDVGKGGDIVGGGGGFGKVISLHVVQQHSNKRHAKRKKARGIESFSDVEDDDDSRKAQRLSFISLGQEEGSEGTAAVSGGDAEGNDDAVEMMESDEGNDQNADGDNVVIEEDMVPNLRGDTPRAESTIPQREDDVPVGVRRLPTQQQLREQQHARQELKNRFQGSGDDSGTSASRGDQKGHGNSQHQSAPLRQQHRQPRGEMRQQQQPPGWRVKLYRLNADGLWDDCGTGRLQFYYARPSNDQPIRAAQSQRQISTDNSIAAGSIFSILGEPMICMRAEFSQHEQHQEQRQKKDEMENEVASENAMPASATGNNDSVSGTPCRQRVLLRTRVILLHDSTSSAYQCQGGNIITWCEPCHNINTNDGTMSGKVNNDKATSSPVGGEGVDLALSFQDSAGCKDIWEQITSIQARARELMLLSSSSVSLSSYDVDCHREETTTGQAQILTSNGGGILDDSNQKQPGKGGGDGVEVKNGGIISSNLYHHQRQQRAPPKEQSPPTHSPLLNTHHHHSFLHNSPNSPDHDAMEDRQLSSLVSSVGGTIKSTSLFSSLGTPSRHQLSETSGDGATLSFGGPEGHFQYEQHYQMDAHNHATDAADGNSFLFSEDSHISSGTNDSDAAAAAATVSSSSGAGAAALGDDDDNLDDDEDGPQPLNRPKDQNHPAPITIPIENDCNNVVLHQNEQQPQQQHSFSNTMTCFTRSSANDDSTNNNINTNNYRQHERRLLPASGPTWNDLSSLREYINNFQFNQGGWGMGLDGGGYQQMMNSSLAQREELLIYLASNDCANLRILLHLFRDVSGCESTDNENNSKKDDSEGSNGGDMHSTYTVSKEGSNNNGDHSINLKSPNGDGDKNDAIEKQDKQNLEEKKESDKNYASLLANTIKSILLLNDPEIIEYVTSDAPIFELLFAVMEYDPDLREKATHVEFLRKHAKFCTVIRIDDDGGSNNDEKNVGSDKVIDDMHTSCGNNDNINGATKSDEYNQYGGINLIANIQRLFRVNYLRDTILRPTMDESNLSTLVSLGQFTMIDIIRGVRAVRGRRRKETDVVVKCGNDTAISNDGCEDGDNYLVRIIRLLGTEMHAIRIMKWKEKEEKDLSSGQRSHRPSSPLQLPLLASKSSQSVTQWKQHVAPQDSSLPSRMIRRRGCLMFLNELFNMARMSLQQHEKDVFIETTVCMPTPLLIGNDDCQKLRDETDETLVKLLAGGESKDEIIVNRESGGVGTVDVVVDDMKLESSKLLRTHVVGMTRSSPSSLPHVKRHINLLSILSSVLSDPTTDVKDRGAALDILGVITMHDPGLIRKYCIEYYNSYAAKQHNVVRPKPDKQGQVIFSCPSDDLILSLIYIMATENDAGLSFQTSEIIRIILDTDSTGSEQQHTRVHGGASVNTAGGDGFFDEQYNVDGGQTSSCGGEGGVTSIESEQNSFLALFYDQYVYWLVAPLNHVILVPQLIQPSIIEQEFEHRTNTSTLSGGNKDDHHPPLLKPIEPCPVRASSSLEIISFCVRAHVHRMKFFMLRTRSLGIILKTLSQKEGPSVIFGPGLPSGIRCLKLAALK